MHCEGRPHARSAAQGNPPSSAAVKPPTLPCSAGDDVRDDVQGAQAAGLAGVLVQTGKYQLGDEGFGAPAASAPDATVPDFAAAVDWLLSQ